MIKKHMLFSQLVLYNSPTITHLYFFILAYKHLLTLPLTLLNYLEGNLSCHGPNIIQNVVFNHNTSFLRMKISFQNAIFLLNVAIEESSNKLKVFSCLLKFQIINVLSIEFCTYFSYRTFTLFANSINISFP